MNDITSTQKPAPAADDRGSQLQVVVLSDPAELNRYAAALDKLAAAALEPNVYYEHWMLRAALHAFGEGADLRLVLIFAPDRLRPHGEPLLCGLFPLERKRHWQGVPVSVLSLWKYPHCVLCTPLIRASHATETLAAFNEWLMTNEAASALFVWKWVSADGPFQQLLSQQFHAAATLFFVAEWYPRAMFRPRRNADEFLANAISGHARRKYRRTLNRLADCGPTEFVRPERGEAKEWVRRFLELEASGWKGREGGALSLAQADESFFRIAASAAHKRGQLDLLALRHNGEFIAMKCNFLAAPGAFAARIAYDERFAHYSPGLLLELENIRQLHDQPQVEWMDSCAIPDHPMINRLWPDRRLIQTLVMATGRAPGALIVSLLPLFRWLNRQFRRRHALPGRERAAFAGEVT